MWEIDIIKHHLQLFGLSRILKDKTSISIFYQSSGKDSVSIEETLSRGCLCIVILPSDELLLQFGFVKKKFPGSVPFSFSGIRDKSSSNLLLRTLHPWYFFISAKACEPIIIDEHDGAVWVFSHKSEGGGILFIGTDLPNDLLRYRQGDPDCVVSNRENIAKWGFEFERPNYLFDRQIEGQPHYVRFADNWAELLAKIVAEKLNVVRDPILPSGAKGAIIITGDDDQAYLDKYQEQLDIIKDTPITYFMHPLTKHNNQSTKKMLNRKNIDLGLHPDALDAPENYASILKDQVAWFHSKFKKYPISVRNHGFLNDGYWGHLPSWINNGLQISSNIPGFDGRALNGSYLPARVAMNGTLTDHWSLLTTIGDGVVFANNYNEKQAETLVYETADTIVQSHIPGIMVLNLHPQNIDKTRSMHRAAINLIKEQGFYPWTIKDCLSWFKKRENIMVDDGASITCMRKKIINKIKWCI